MPDIDVSTHKPHNMLVAQDYMYVWKFQPYGSTVGKCRIH